VVRGAFEDGDVWFNADDLLRTIDAGFAFGFTHFQLVDRFGDTFRWKSENVSTSEVGRIITLHPDISLSNFCWYRPHSQSIPLRHFMRSCQRRSSHEQRFILIQQLEPRTNHVHHAPPDFRHHGRLAPVHLDQPETR